MLLEIKERVIEIAESISLPNSKTITGLQFLVDSVSNTNLPALIPLVRGVTYKHTDARGFIASIQMDLYLYIRAIGEVNQAQAAAEPMVMLDLFTEAFLTRPQLQYNGQVLTSIVNNIGIGFELIQGLDEPVYYPPKSRDGQAFWGAVFRLSIQKRLTYQINVSGA